LLDNIDPTLCDAHVAAPFGDEVLFSVARKGAVNQCPDYTLRANKTYEDVDIVDHGFVSFCQYSPQDTPTIRDFIIENGICTLSGLAEQGYPFGKQGLPAPLTWPAPAFIPDCIHTKTRLTVPVLQWVQLTDDVTPGGPFKYWVQQSVDVFVEDYTVVPNDSTSLCALLGDSDLTELCRDCKGVPVFVAVSSVDWCLKQLGGVFYREMCLNPTATGTTTSDGYTSPPGSYELDPITSIMRFAPVQGNKQIVECDYLQLDFVPVPVVLPDLPLNVSLRVGVSAQPADPNDPNAPIVWYQRSAKPLAYKTAKSSAQHLAAGTQPSEVLAWKFFHEGRFLYFELTIAGNGGDSTFSKIAAGLQGGPPALNY